MKITIKNEKATIEFKEFDLDLFIEFGKLLEDKDITTICMSFNTKFTYKFNFSNYETVENFTYYKEYDKSCFILKDCQESLDIIEKELILAVKQNYNLK